MKEYTITVKVLLKDDSDTDWIFTSIDEQLDQDNGEMIAEWKEEVKDAE